MSIKPLFRAEMDVRPFNCPLQQVLYRFNGAFVVLSASPSDVAASVKVGLGKGGLADGPHLGAP